ncbi:MAG: FAD binding domain-containing protein [Amaricoccus sp.]|uniref:FAD binding domain-containing protein n=1 Tax=Amaricoccus sp. TaxID=1872485 RepID=UPI0039E6228F
MDLNAITSHLRPADRGGLPVHQPGDACLAGGTWLFSEPQPTLRRLIDLTSLGWAPLAATEDGLAIAATCKVATLDAFEPPAAWIGAELIGRCCRAFLASFKIWNMATVGGNLCMGLPAGPMISLAVALDGVCTIWTPDGGERRVPVVDFVRGPLQPDLVPGEVLRRIDLPRAALVRRAAFRRASLTPLGRSGVLLIGTSGAGGDLALTVTASTRRPVRLDFDAPPSADDLARAIDMRIEPALYYDDIHGRPDWRRHMTHLFAREIRDELAGAIR